MANPLLGLRSALFTTGASEAITYTPAGPSSAGVPVRAVRSSIDASDISNLGGNPLRGITFEIQRADLAVTPKANDQIIADGNERWSVTQVTDQDVVQSWLLTVRRAPPAP